MKNILIYPCGADNALEIYHSIRFSLHFNVLGANSKDSIADLIYDTPTIRLPNINEKTFLKVLNEIISERNIDFIFPTHDDVIFYLSSNASKINCKIIGGDYNTNLIVRNKKLTYDHFKKFSFCPKLYNSLDEIQSFPVFAKPCQGHGSIGAKKINSSNDINNIDLNKNVITEYLPGKEYTVDCLTDKNGELIYSYARLRYVVRNGVSHINKEAKDEIQKQVKKIGEIINKNLSFNGLWFFQVKQDSNGKLKLLEICTRMATTMSFARFKGVNLPLLTLFSNMGLDIKAQVTHNNIKLYRCSQTKVKYNFSYENVYIDFDDTLIINNKVCLDAISFIYQCQNKGIDVILISKHQFNISKTLAEYNIPKDIFSEIIIISMDEPKYKHINKKKAIFIDNYYFERNSVYENLKIPVFDVDSLKDLIIN